jgi:signal transduction histidine kinase
MGKATNKVLSSFEKNLRNLTIHQRVALLTSGGLIVLGLILVLIINLIAPLLITVSISVPDTVLLVDTVDPQGTPITILMETPGPEGYTISQIPNTPISDPITVLRLLSIIGLIIFAGLGIMASRWLARVSLQPISTISQKASNIDAISVDQRLNYQGPQDGVKTLADTIDAMLNRLDLNYERQGQFISNLAHELRTPLSVIRMNIEELILDPEATMDEYHLLAETAERSLSRLERLSEDILLLAKGETEISHQPVVLGVLIDEVIEELAPLAQEHQISLNLDGEIEAEIIGDAVLLQSAILNMVKNGILYNHPGGFVKTFIYSDGKWVVVEVKDNGIGILDTDQAKIFDRFYRAKNEHEESVQGKGLGLAIVKHIVELHQGRIEVNSKLGGGSTFRIYLPTM